MHPSFIQQHRSALLVFSVGVAVALLFAFVPPLHAFITGIDRLGYVGMFIAGLLYTSAMTSATATIIIAQAGPSLQPLLIGLVGGLGAMTFDTAIFLFSRNESAHGWLAHVLVRIRERRHVPNWAFLFLGGLIIASPLPDELAAGLLGITYRKLGPFLVLSFVANALGIYLISNF